MPNQSCRAAIKAKRAWYSKPKNPPKGEFLAMFRKGEGTWRIQLFATGPSPDARKVTFRFQLWSHPEQGGRPKTDGPSGFSLTLAEVKKLIEALAAALEKIETGEFDLLDDNNALPGRSR